MIDTDFILPISLMMLQGILGAIDTIYYHEYRYRLPAYAKEARSELRLHGWRDLIYGILFISLPRFQWQGYWAWLLALLLIAEILITLVDFVIERDVRRPWGGLAAGELCMHAVMAILYGAFLITFSPHWLDWNQGQTQFSPHQIALPEGIIGLMTLMGIGVSTAGIRDLLLSATWLSPSLHHALAFPWSRTHQPPLIVPSPTTKHHDPISNDKGDA